MYFLIIIWPRWSVVYTSRKLMNVVVTCFKTPQTTCEKYAREKKLTSHTHWIHKYMNKNNLFCFRAHIMLLWLFSLNFAYKINWALIALIGRKIFETEDISVFTYYVAIMYICLISPLFLSYIAVPFMWKKVLKGISNVFKFRTLRYCQNIMSRGSLFDYV